MVFSGIVEEIGTVQRASPDGLTIAASRVLAEIRLGDSIAVNGTCLTVTDLTADTFSIGLGAETLRRTNLGELRPGDRVNLERALAVGDRIGGHFVQGHVDGTGRVARKVPEGSSILVAFAAPAEVRRYVVRKGFIAVDGISLTVVDCTADGFSVSLVPFTIEHTALGQKEPGATVNLEVDILGKYVERFIENRPNMG